MSRKKKLSLGVLAADVVCCLFFAFGFRNWIVPIAANALCVFLAGCALAVNKVLLSSNWYKSLFVDFEHERYPDNVWYRKHDERNFDLINLGSNSSKYAFDYSELGVKAMNFAPGSQTLIDDFRLVQNYHSILKLGGVVLISIMPFTSINKKTGFIDSFKYCKSLDSALIDEKYRRKCYLYARFPILFGKTAARALVKKLMGKDRIPLAVNKTQNNPMSETELEADARQWITGWKKQFAISDMSAPLTQENQRGREVRIGVMRNLIDFCTERGYKPVYVIPPMTEYLDSYFTGEVKQIYIYDFLTQVNRNIPLFDYSHSQDLMDKDLYFNSFFMNERGARCFTSIVTGDIMKKLYKRHEVNQV